MKKFISAMLVLVLVLSMTACGAPASAEKETAAPENAAVADPINVYCIAPSGATIWDELQRGFEEGVEKYGWQGQYVGPGIASYNDMEAVSLAETAVTNGADVIMIMVADFTVAYDALKNAVDQGVVVILLGGYVEEQMKGAVTSTVSIDPVTIAAGQCDALDEIVGDEEALLIYMRSQLANPAQTASWEYICSHYENVPNISIQGQYESLADTTKGADIIANLRKVDPVNAIIMSDSAATIGVANYIQENNLEDEIYMVGIDYEEQILQYVKDGVIDKLAIQDWYSISHISCDVVNDVLNGASYEMSNDANCTILDAENVQEFADNLGFELK